MKTFLVYFYYTCWTQNSVSRTVHSGGCGGSKYENIGYQGKVKQSGINGKLQIFKIIKTTNFCWFHIWVNCFCSIVINYLCKKSAHLIINQKLGINEN